MPKFQATQTDWRIIGVSGDTIDGREISAQELQEMADSYDPEIYCASINLEHARFFYPDSWEGGYGNVLELKTEPWVKDPKKTALLAKLNVLPRLQNLWDVGEKLFTSMEVRRNFADTGKAYLEGLAITNSPASLGTTQNFNVATAHAQVKQTYFTSYQQYEQENEMQPEKNESQDKPLSEPKAKKLFSDLFKEWFGTKEAEQNQSGKTTASNEEPSTQESGQYTAKIEHLEKELSAAAQFGEQTMTELSELKKQFTDLVNRLEKEPQSGERKPHSGGNDAPKVGW